MMHYKVIKYVRNMNKIQIQYCVTPTNFKFWIRYTSCYQALQSKMQRFDCKMKYNLLLTNFFQNFSRCR
jgi:hypothetical protein